MDQNKEAEKKLKQLQSDYKIIFGSDEGKRVLDDISKRCHEFNTTHCKAIAMKAHSLKDKDQSWFS